MSEIYNKSINDLAHEGAILQKILYRNKAQHGKTETYRRLHKVNQLLQNLQVDQLEQIRSQANNSLRTSKKSESNSDVATALNCLHAVYNMIEVFGNILSWSAYATKSIGKQLAMKVFIPLLSLCLVAVARIFKCISIMMIHFESLRLSLLQKLEHVRTVMPRHENLVTTELNKLHLKKDTITMLRSIQNSRHSVGWMSGTTSTSISTTNNNNNSNNNIAANSINNLTNILLAPENKAAIAIAIAGGGSECHDDEEDIGEVIQCDTTTTTTTSLTHHPLSNTVPLTGSDVMTSAKTNHLTIIPPVSTVKLSKASNLSFEMKNSSFSIPTAGLAQPQSQSPSCEVEEEEEEKEEVVIEEAMTEELTTSAVVPLLVREEILPEMVAVAVTTPMLSYLPTRKRVEKLKDYVPDPKVSTYKRKKQKTNKSIMPLSSPTVVNQEIDEIFNILN